MRTSLTFAALLALTAGMVQADTTLTILHTNDLHARFEPINRFDSTCPPEDNAAGDCFGGIARLATAIAQARSEHDTTLLVDAGDPFQGTLFYTFYKGQMAAEMMTRLGYEAMAVGNHEFDDGPRVLREFAAAVPFPLLMANADTGAEADLDGATRKSVVIEKDGMRLGLIGLTPQNNDELASPGPNILFSDPVPATQAEIDRLTDDGVDKIILLSHSGIEVDRRIARETTGLDVIVGGHSHTLLSNSDDRADGPYPLVENDVPIVQAYAYGKYLGRLTVTFDDAGRVTQAAGDPIVLDATVAEETAIVARVAELAEPLEEIRNQVVAETTEAIDGDRGACRAGECLMGNLVADAMLARVQGQGIQVALQNGGGMRASIDKGTVTMGEVLTVLPFQNTLSTYRVTGATLLAALENGFSQIEDGAGRFPQVAGLRVVFDPQAEPGSRVVSVEVAGDEGFAPLDPETVYGMVSNNYVRGGGDGYAMFATQSRDVYDFGPDLADVVAEYLADTTPYQPYLDGRIAAR